jgi:hypothetical protein
MSALAVMRQHELLSLCIREVVLEYVACGLK